MVDPTAKNIEIAPGLTMPADRLTFAFAKSGGPGGQHVNKTATAVTLTVPLAALAECLPGEAIHRLKRQAGHRLAGDRLVIQAADSRSQHANRKACLLKLRRLIVEAQHRPTPRRPTRPSRAAKQRRLDTKKQRGQRKGERRTNRQADEA
jgi:ribosome-associated protein